MGRKKLWRSLFSVTENGETKYGISDQYDGLETIALRLYENANDPDGNSLPHFSRLDGVTEVSEDEYEAYANPSMASKFRILAAINTDKNKISVYEKKEKKYEHYTYPLDAFIGHTGKILNDGMPVRYDTLKILKLYQHLKTNMDELLESTAPDGPDDDSTLEAEEPEAPVQSM